MEGKYLAGEDKGDLLWQRDADALHDPVRHRVCAAVLAPARQVLLCWRTILHHGQAYRANLPAHLMSLCGTETQGQRDFRTSLQL